MKTRPRFSQQPPLNGFSAGRSFRLFLPALLGFSTALPLPSPAQDVAGIADREIVRRQEGLLLAEASEKKGDRAMERKDFEAAYANYLDALERIPEGPATAKQRAPLVAKFSKAALDYANKLISDGRFSDAERVAKTILLPQFDPENRAAVRLLSRLEQPDHFNKTITPAFAADREEVKKLLNEAKGFFDAGRFDLAMKRYEQVLLIDPYNNAARMGMEEIGKQQSTYYASAYNETRSRLLWLADSAWERPVNKNLTTRTTVVEDARRSGVRGNEAITEKLNRIIIPKIQLRDTTVREAVEFLKQRSRDLDTTSDDPAQKRGVNIVLKLTPSLPPPPPAEGEPAPETPALESGSADTRITMSLTNVPLVEALRYLTELANLKFKVEPFAVLIVPMTENVTDLVNKEYKVPPGFIPSGTGAPTGGFAAPAAGGQGDLTAQRIQGRADAKSYLESQGVPFPPGAFAQYVPAGSKLIVRNTPDALDLIDYLVDAAMGVQPTQVEIESKFLEVSQDNLSELGFNWLLGPVQIGGSGVYGAGGTQGFGDNLNPTAPNPNTYPFVSGGLPVGQNPITGGLRSGVGVSPDAAITANSIDALIRGIAPGTTATAPGIFGIAGIFTNPQFQVVIRALSQKKGVDLMSAPKVTTKSGRKATVRVVRQFPYPTEFNPPDPPPPVSTSGGGGVVVVSGGALISGGVVTPSTPTQFEIRNIGVTLEVEPIIGPDNYTIDLKLSPEVVEFDGFINYGSPIRSARYVAVPPSIVPTIVTPNEINQPVFSTRKVTTSVSIWDGQTVALGGLIREDIQKTNDKVPILGDIPIAGRLFRSDVDQKVKRNLIIFTTARLMDAEGRPVRQDEADQEEIVEPLGLPPDLPRPQLEPAQFRK